MEITKEEEMLLDELIKLGDELSLIYYYSWLAPKLDGKREVEILKKMKEIVNKLTERKLGEVI